MLSIFEYREPNEYLRDLWTTKRQKNPQFTIRAWANQMGIKHHAPLHEMVNGKRKIPKSLVPSLIKHLNLEATEALFFEFMVDLSRSKSPEQKTMYLERMKSIAPYNKEVKFTELESFRMLQDPIHFFICEMVYLPDFQPEAAWIQKRLTIEASLERISSAIERLLLLDILREDPQGKLIRVDQFIHTKSDIKDKALQAYHANLSELAKNAVEEQPLLEREFQAMTMNFEMEKMPEAKAMIREFLQQFTAKFDKPSKTEKEIYHINLQFFGITKNQDKK